MLTRLRFQNFKALRDALLELGPFNLIVGPNGSGKTTVLQTLRAFRDQTLSAPGTLRTFGSEGRCRTDLVFTEESQEMTCTVDWESPPGTPPPAALWRFAQHLRVFHFDTRLMRQPAPEAPLPTALLEDGSNLAACLYRIERHQPGLFETLSVDLARWLPEYMGIAFEHFAGGRVAFRLRRARGGYLVSPTDLSDGTISALGLLALTHLPGDAALVCIEEPEKGLHPRLLREARDALYRLAFPEQFGLERPPIQVIATTHSPYFLDLFQDAPDQVILAEKHEDDTASFRNLGKDPVLRELLGGSSLGELWFSGVLGAVPRF